MPITLHCQQCHGAFTVPPAWAAKRRFCSKDCLVTWRQRNAPTCLTCGNPLQIPASQVDRVKYCSAACRTARQVAGRPARFWVKVNKDGPIPTHCPHLGPCWEWRGARHEHGYGLFPIGTQAHRNLTLLAHRVAWELTNGPLPARAHVLHRCDNPPCVNPAHLFLGTQRMNNEDRDAKDRVRHGDAHPNAKLTVAAVRRMRTLYATGAITQRELAETFGVSHQSVADAIAGKTWRRA